MSLYISTASASSDLRESHISLAIVRLAALVAGLRRQGRLDDQPKLDVRFLLPGKLEKVPFSGMQMGGYTVDNNTLFFDCSVPEHIVHSDHADDYLGAVMDDVVANAVDFFRGLDTGFDARLWYGQLAGIIGPRQALNAAATENALA